MISYQSILQLSGWLRSQVPYDLNIPLAERPHHRGAMSQSSNKKCLNTNFDGFKAGDYYIIDIIPRKCILYEVY